MFRHKDTPIVFFLWIYFCYMSGVSLVPCMSNVFVTQDIYTLWLFAQCELRPSSLSLCLPCRHCKQICHHSVFEWLCVVCNCFFSWCWCTNFIKRLPILQTISCVIQLATLVDVPLFQSTASVYVEAGEGTGQFYIGLHIMANVQNGAIWTQSEILSSRLRKWPFFSPWSHCANEGIGKQALNVGSL